MKYHIITYGCQMNKSDSERLAAKLEKKGYRPAKIAEKADLVVLNVCSIRQSAVNRVYSKIKQLKDNKKKIFLTGCILEKDRKEWKKEVDKILPFSGLEIKPRYSVPEKAFVPIMTGCNNFCSYCVVPYLRGRERSRPVEKIVRQIKCLVKNGCREIILIGQNVNSYHDVILSPAFSGAKNPVENNRCCLPRDSSFASLTQDDKVINFPKLLGIINDIPGDFQIKFLTSHPKDMSDELIKVISQSDKIAKEIHLPVQSGDNQILKKMNRGYTVADYKKLVKKIQKRIPSVELSTDIIVGFPGETKKQFQNSVKLCKEIGFRQIYAAAFSPRSETAAARLKDNVSSFEKKQRKRKILGLIK